jgi:hypothetical protein
MTNLFREAGLSSGRSFQRSIDPAISIRPKYPRRRDHETAAILRFAMAKPPEATRQRLR